VSLVGKLEEFRGNGRMEEWRERKDGRREGWKEGRKEGKFLSATFHFSLLPFLPIFQFTHHSPLQDPFNGCPNCASSGTAIAKHTVREMNPNILDCIYIVPPKPIQQV